MREDLNFNKIQNWFNQLLNIQSQMSYFYGEGLYDNNHNVCENGIKIRLNQYFDLDHFEEFYKAINPRIYPFLTISNNLNDTGFLVWLYNGRADFENDTGLIDLVRSIKTTNLNNPGPTFLNNNKLFIKINREEQYLVCRIARNNSFGFDFKEISYVNPNIYDATINSNKVFCWYILPLYAIDPDIFESELILNILCKVLEYDDLCYLLMRSKGIRLSEADYLRRNLA